MSERIFICGSGASARNASFHFNGTTPNTPEICLPTLSDLLEMVYRNLHERHQNILGDYFGIRLAGDSLVSRYNFEQLLNIVHVGNRLFKSNWTVPPIESNEFGQPFDFDALEDSLINTVAGIMGLSSAPFISKTHAMFTERVVSTGDLLVTFNYDLLLDNALIRSGKWHPHDGYGYSFYNTEGSSQSSDVKLLKLHGSVNWIRFAGISKSNRLENEVGQYALCDYRNGYFYAATGQTISAISKPQDDSYRELSGKILIVPPLIQKDTMAYMILSRLWYAFYQALLGCKEIYVIGYSMPESDTWIRDFFRLAAAERKKKNIKPPLVRVIDVAAPSPRSIELFFANDLKWECPPCRPRSFREWIEKRTSKATV